MQRPSVQGGSQGRCLFLFPELLARRGYRFWGACRKLPGEGVPGSKAVPASVTFIGKSAFKKSAFMSRESLTLTVDRDSYALQYAKENGIDYTYTDALDWLNS